MLPVVRLLALACLVGLLAACGAGGGAGADGDPASLVPADASLYFEAQVRPKGDRKKEALAAAGKLLRTPDPEQRLNELLERKAKESGEDFDYDRDVKPWLGERAGAYAANLAADEPSGLVIAATTDQDKARDAVEAAIGRSRSSRGKLTTREYEGVEYQVDRERTAYGIVDGFLAVGDEAQLKRTIKTADGKSLAETDRYQDTLDGLTAQRLGTGYLDVKGLIDAAAKADPETAGQLDQFTGKLDLDKLAPVGLAFLANGDRLTVEGVQSTKGAGELYRRLALLSVGASTPLTADLPADAWGAYGIPKLGATAKELYGTFAGALGGAAISGQLEQQLGLSLEEDVFSWIGDTAVFVRGAREDALEGALVIQATDPAKARRAVAKLVGVATKQDPTLGLAPARLEGAELAFRTAALEAKGKPVVVAVGGERVVVALGEAAARDGLKADGETLGDTPGYDRIKGALGGLEPSFFVDVPRVLALADAEGASTDPEFAKAKPYLETLAAVASGAKQDGDRLVSRFSVSLKE